MAKALDDQSLRVLSDMARWWVSAGPDVRNRSRRRIATHEAHTTYAKLKETLLPGDKALAILVVRDSNEPNGYKDSSPEVEIEVHDPFKRAFGLEDEYVPISTNRGEGSAPDKRRREIIGEFGLIRKAKNDAAITAGSLGDVSVWAQGADSTVNVEAHLNWHHGGEDIGEADTEIRIQWFADEEKWVVISAECESPEAIPSASAAVASSQSLVEALDVRPLLARPSQQVDASTHGRFEVIIKSFRRFESLLRCVSSIRNYYPGTQIRIADDSYETLPDNLPPEIVTIQSFPEVDWHWLPFDIGLGAGRNYLVRQTAAPVVINFDDDFLVTEETDLEAMVRVIERDSSVDLLGGLVRTGGVVQNWCGHLQRDLEARTVNFNLLKSPWQQIENAAYRQTDLAFNFFAARRKTLLNNPWDEQFKIVGEHLDHFLSMHKNCVGVYYTKSSIIAHIHDRPEDYKPFRDRKEYLKPLLRKWGLKETPNHLANTEPGFQKRDMTELVRKSLGVTANLHMLKTERPNIVVLGVGHSNTTITTRQIGALGWELGDADEEYAESVSVRDINLEFLKTGQFPADKAHEVLAALPYPWVVKDPRFCRTLPHWIGPMRYYAPLLLWVKKDLEEVKKSHLRRGEKTDDVDALFRNAEKFFDQWPFAKFAIDAEDIGKAAALFDLQKGQL